MVEYMKVAAMPASNLSGQRSVRCSYLAVRYVTQNKCVTYKGGQTAILVRWSAAQRTTEMFADQRQRNTEIELPLVRC
jgi:hypothetical protein